MTLFWSHVCLSEVPQLQPWHFPVPASDCQDEEDASEEIPYASPTVPRDSFFTEHFDDPAAFERRWVRSKAKKDGADDEIAKYDGNIWLWAARSERCRPRVSEDDIRGALEDN